jgi:hypothetical protein
MKMSRALFSPVVLSFLVLAIAGGLAGGTPARAADTLVPITGTVSGQPESVAFSGQARVGSRLLKAPDGTPIVMIVINLSGVSGTGSSTAAKYAIPGAETFYRRLVASDRVEVTFPFLAGENILSARSGVASFALSFDVATGAVTAAKGAVTSPNFPD